MNRYLIFTALAASVVLECACVTVPGLDTSVTPQQLASPLPAPVPADAVKYDEHQSGLIDQAIVPPQGLSEGVVLPDLRICGLVRQQEAPRFVAQTPADPMPLLYVLSPFGEQSTTLHGRLGLGENRVDGAVLAVVASAHMLLIACLLLQFGDALGPGMRRAWR